MAEIIIAKNNRPMPNASLAIGLYRKMGFLEEGRRVREIKIADGKYVDDILMYRFIKN